MADKPRFSLATWLMCGWIAVALAWWFFALAPLPDTSPQWIETARAVCFGSLPNGLPEGYGWITLVLTPLLVAIGLVVIWAQELSRDMRSLRSSSSGRLALLFALLVVCGSLGWGLWRVREVKQANEALAAANVSEQGLAEESRLNLPTPEFELIDQSGQTLSNKELLGDRVVMTFAFAHCQSICPGLVQTMTRAVEETSGPRPRLVVVTLDPWRDTPRALPGLAKKWELKKGDHVLSGEVDAVQAVIEAFRQSASRNLQNGDITHQGVAYVLDPQGRLAFRIEDPSVKATKQALDRVLQDGP